MMRGGQNLSAACALVSARRAKLFISTPSTPLPEKILSVLKLWWGLGGDFHESLPPSYPIVLSCVSCVHGYLVELEQAGLERFAFRVQLAECGIVGGVKL